jgi:hypothetical protein
MSPVTTFAAIKISAKLNFDLSKIPMSFPKKGRNGKIHFYKYDKARHRRRDFRLTGLFIQSI